MGMPRVWSGGEQHRSGPGAAGEEHQGAFPFQKL